MRSLFLATLMLLVLAAPTGAIITDQEPANDNISTAPLVISKTGPVTTDGGELVLVAGDIDFLGLEALSAGDVVTVSTTPLDDSAFQVPDTIVGLFDGTTVILCRVDDSQNNDMDNCPGGDCPGWGSLCRFQIPAPGNYHVGVSGFRSVFPPGCDPAVPPGCTSFPFDGGIGPVPCEESDGDTITCGNYQVTIAVNAVPEPGVVLQLVSGGIGLAFLYRRRTRPR
jgi:hypothetical protein